MKERPSLTTSTAAAWFNWPMSDCRCLFIVDCLDDHRCRVLSSWTSLACGSLSSYLRESIKIARKMMEVDGLATLLAATGRHNSLHKGMVILRAFPAAEEV